MQRRRIYIFFGFWLLASCNNSEQITIKYVDNDPLFFDYKIWGEEDRDFMTVMLQFRTEDESGFTRALKSPSNVAFDLQELKVDSSKMSGFFYEIEKSRDSFPGKHVISFTDSLGRIYKESLEFRPFFLKNIFPKILHRSDLSIELTGLKDHDLVRLIMLDTAFKSRGINDIDTVKNGMLRIDKNKWKDLVNGNIHLELYKEDEWPVKNGTTAGGFVTLTYGLKREFQLVD